METATNGVASLAASSKQLARRLLIIGENRLELLTVEVREERERLLHAFLLALGAAAFGLLASLALSAAVVVLLWAYSPVAVLLTLAGLYGLAGGYLCRRVAGRLRDCETFSASLDQLRKDRSCLETILT